MSLLKETLLVFTDLDGTLLDIHTYDWRPASAWLDKLQDHQIPVILCSSKTAAETLEIQQDLGWKDCRLLPRTVRLSSWMCVGMTIPMRRG